MDLSCFNLNDTTGYVATLELGHWPPYQGWQNY
jgi:hypothetical protein